MSKSVLKKKVRFDENAEEPIENSADENEGYEADVQGNCANEMEQMLINHIKQQKEENQAEKTDTAPQTQSDQDLNEGYSETTSYVSEEDSELFKPVSVHQDIEDFLQEQSPFQRLLFFMTQLTTPEFRQYVKSGAPGENMRFKTCSSEVKEFLAR